MDLEESTVEMSRGLGLRYRVLLLVENLSLLGADSLGTLYKVFQVKLEMQENLDVRTWKSGVHNRRVFENLASEMVFCKRHLCKLLMKYAIQTSLQGAQKAP